MRNEVDREKLKQEYVKYFEDVPVQKYAAMAIGRDEDTIIRWRKDDPDFAEAVLKAKAEFIRKKVLATKAEFALERLEREVFSPQLTITHQAELQDTRDKIKAFLDDTSDLVTA